MTRLTQKLTLALALLGIFVSGAATGWFGHRAGQTPVAPAPVAADPAATAAWTDRAMVTLTRELQLTPEQVEAIRPVLVNAAGRMDIDKERAMFQLHVQVLQTHDEMRPHLRPDQIPALEKMRERLKSDIKRRFAAFLQDPAHPTPDL